jgi:hypothetical protein
VVDGQLFDVNGSGRTRPVTVDDEVATYAAMHSTGVYPFGGDEFNIYVLRNTFRADTDKNGKIETNDVVGIRNVYNPAPSSDED